MANETVNNLKSKTNNFVAATFLLVVVMLIIPFPAVLIDLMMIVNLAISVIILLAVLYTPKSADLTSFPRIIIFSTIFALALNVRSTFFILQNGGVGFEKFDAQMIKAFAQIVAGDNLVLGLVIFVILIVIQTVVIAKGTSRISEVQARFALDSMNSKMFAVDSELNSGSITEEQAREKKAAIQRESDFYSTMDGATKFVGGTVKAGIFITLVNLIAGIILGMVQHKMQFSDAIQTFSKLTIGDGLLSQLPSLFISLATAILVAGSSSSTLLGEQLKKEFSISGNIYLISGGLLIFMGVMFFILGKSGSLFVLLLFMGALLCFAGYSVIKNEKLSLKNKKESENKTKAESQKEAGAEDISPVSPPDALSLEIGVALIDLVDKQKGAELLNRITKIRKEEAIEMGLVVPKIRIVDNLSLDPQEYCFKIHGIEAGRGKLKLGYFMCIDTGTVIEKIKGEETNDPVFGVPAIWVSEEQRVEAERAGYSVIDSPTIIATHMTEIIRSNAAKILGRQEVSAIITKIKEKYPVVVEEVIDTYKYTYGEIEKILRGLLRERVSIRDIVAILETLANYGMYTPHNIPFLIGKVRETLGIWICQKYADPDTKKLSALKLGQNWIDLISSHSAEGKNGEEPYLAFDLVDGRNWISTVSASLAAMREKNFLPIIVCPAEIRQVVYNSLEPEMPGTIVLSYNELISAGKNINLEIVGEIK